MASLIMPNKQPEKKRFENLMGAIYRENFGRVVRNLHINQINIEKLEKFVNALNQRAKMYNAFKDDDYEFLTKTAENLKKKGKRLTQTDLVELFNPLITASAQLSRMYSMSLNTKNLPANVNIVVIQLIHEIFDVPYDDFFNI